MTAGGFDVTTHDAAGMRTVTIDRADKRNALDRATLEALEAAFAATAEDGNVRVIVLRGAGDRAFCAGAAGGCGLRDAIVLPSRTEDAREGITAFFEKRRPRWTGR